MPNFTDQNSLLTANRQVSISGPNPEIPLPALERKLSIFLCLQTHLNYLLHVFLLTPDRLPNLLRLLEKRLIDRNVLWCKECQESGWQHGIDVAWDEGGGRVREQLIAVWDAVRGRAGLKNKEIISLESKNLELSNLNCRDNKYRTIIKNKQLLRLFG